MLILTDGIALVAAAFLLLEWRTSGERFLMHFAIGFLSIVVGCALAPLREYGSFLIGIWLSNSMLPLAHYFFLRGAAAFSGRAVSPLWILAPLGCCAFMGLPNLVARTEAISMANAGVVAILSLRAAYILHCSGHAKGSGVRILAGTLWVHGSFYLIKALCAFAPGAFVDLSNYSGTMILISLFEGVLVAVAMAMAIATVLSRRREDQAIHLAETDALTGLLNRRGFEARAADVLACKNPASEGAMLLIDVDRFKSVNDRLGHQGGDRLLVSLAAFLKTHTPAASVIARIGGDEFAILAPGVDEFGTERMARILCNGFQHEGLNGAGTISVGCAMVAPDLPTLHALHEAADQALYDAKRAGRNRTSVRRPLQSGVSGSSGPQMAPAGAAA